MRILLTGGSGQVGWELQRSLSLLGDLHVFDRSSLDLSNPDQIRQRVREISPGLIVNAAAYTAVDKAESERDLAMAVNSVAPGVLAEEARAHNAALVHYSTDYVFDGGGEKHWCESDAPAPINVYGKSKLAGEEAIKSAGIPHLILRTSWVYGINGHNFVKTILRVGSEREEMKIVDDQIGAPTSARVIADGTALILARMGNDINTAMTEDGGIYHLCCSGETSWCGFATEIAEQARQHEISLALSQITPVPTSEYPTPARRPKNSRLDCVRLTRQFGLQLPSWQDALAHAFPMIARGVG